MPNVRLECGLTGAAGLMARLSALDAKAVKPAARAGVNDATRIVLWAARANLAANGSVVGGALSGALGRKVKTYPSGVVYGIVGPRRDQKGRVKFRKVFVTPTGKAVLRNPAMYAHLVEFGTAPHALGAGSKLRAGRGSKRAGRQAGRTHPGARAKPFLRPAWDDNRAAAVAALRLRLKDAIRSFGG